MLALTALVLSLMSNLWCDAIEFAPVQDSQGEVQFLPTRAYGPFFEKKIAITFLTNYTVVSEMCVNYNGDVASMIDAKWKSSQAFSIIVLMIGAPLMFWTWVAPCVYDNLHRHWKPAGFLCLFCSICQGLTLLFLSSSACSRRDGLIFPGAYPETCTWGWGAKTNIAAVTAWGLAGYAMLAFPAYPPEEGSTKTVEQHTKQAQSARTVVDIEKGTSREVQIETIESKEKQIPHSDDDARSDENVEFTAGAAGYISMEDDSSVYIREDASEKTGGGVKEKGGVDIVPNPSKQEEKVEETDEDQLTAEREPPVGTSIIGTPEADDNLSVASSITATSRSLVSGYVPGMNYVQQPVTTADETASIAEEASVAGASVASNVSRASSSKLLVAGRF